MNKEQIKEQAKKFLDDRYENAKIWQTVSIVELLADFHLSQTSELSDEWIREWGAKYYNDCMESDWTDMTPEDHFNAGAAFYRTHHSQAPQLTEEKVVEILERYAVNTDNGITAIVGGFFKNIAKEIVSLTQTGKESKDG